MLRSRSLRTAYARGQQRRLRPIEKQDAVYLPQFDDGSGNLTNLGADTTLSDAAANGSPMRTLGANPLITLDGTDDYYEIDDNDALDVTAAQSFLAMYAGDVVDNEPTPAQVMWGKGSIALSSTTAGWRLINNVNTNFNFQFNHQGGGAVVNDVIAAPTVGSTFVFGGRRDVAADDGEAFLDGAGSGSPTADGTTTSLANSNPARIGASGDGTAEGFLAGECYGVSWRKHDPAVSDAEVDRVSRELLSATGRFL